MASAWGLNARLQLAQQALDMEAAAGAVAGGGARGTLKLMLLKSTYSPDIVNHDHVDDGGANDPIDHEADATGYTGGYGGAGRKAVSGSLNPAWARDNANSRIEFDFDNVTWTALGNGTNNTLGGVGLICEDFEASPVDDTDSLFISFDDTNNVTTNGGDITYAPNAEAVIQV